MKVECWTSWTSKPASRHIAHYILITKFMHWLSFIHKIFFPLHVSSLKWSSSGGYSCIHAAYGTVTLYESSCWPVGTQLEWEPTVGGRLLVVRLRRPTNNLPPTVSSHSSCVPTGNTKSRREWQYHMLHVYNCVLLKMITWGSKHVEEKIFYE